MTMRKSVSSHPSITFSGQTQFAKRIKADALVVPFWEEKKADLAKAGLPIEKEISRFLTIEEFKGKNGELLIFYPDHFKEKRLIFLGLGKKKDSLSEAARLACSAISREAKQKGFSSVNVIVPDNVDPIALVEALQLSNYEFQGYKSERTKKEGLKKVQLVGAGKKELNRIETVQASIEGAFLARDLVNRNADEITPSFLAKLAKGLANEFSSIKTKTLTKKMIEKEKMGLLLAVNRGSQSAPAFIISHYRGNPGSKEKTVLVGKGITYDSGGLNLKSNMLTMKSDMGGAAACLGTLFAAARSKLKTNLTIVIAATENAIDAKSYKPGDVYTGMSGKSVEIGNTDAEGRLILADALAYATKHLKPSRVIDIATLTGAMVISLGSEVAGFMCNDQKLADQLIDAGEKTYERVARLPLIDEYVKSLQSDIADLKNVGGREAGAVKAALFLREFIGDYPWAHLDIAGTAYRSEGRGYHPKNATGVGVRLMMQFLEGIQR